MAHSWTPIAIHPLTGCLHSGPSTARVLRHLAQQSRRLIARDRAADPELGTRVRRLSGMRPTRAFFGSCRFPHRDRKTPVRGPIVFEAWDPSRTHCLARDSHDYARFERRHVAPRAPGVCRTGTADWALTPADDAKSSKSSKRYSLMRPDDRQLRHRQYGRFWLEGVAR